MRIDEEIIHGDRFLKNRWKLMTFSWIKVDFSKIYDNVMDYNRFSKNQW